MAPIECCICMEEINKTKSGLVETPCGHKFCLICIGQHLRENENCPLCRETICTPPSHQHLPVQQIMPEEVRLAILEDQYLEIRRAHLKLAELLPNLNSHHNRQYAVKIYTETLCNHMSLRINAWHTGSLTFS